MHQLVAKYCASLTGFFPDEMVKVISDQMGDQMEQAKAVIDQLDVDKDGKVSYPEFILVMKYKK